MKKKGFTYWVGVGLGAVVLAGVAIPAVYWILYLIIHAWKEVISLF